MLINQQQAARCLFIIIEQVKLRHQTEVIQIYMEGDCDPHSFIKNPQFYQQYQCTVCLNVSLQPYRCQGPCKKIYCCKCVANIRVHNDRCPNLCSKPFEVTKVSQPKCQFCCPYSKNCQSSISSVKEFQKHYKHCQFVQKDIVFQLNLKREYKCMKGHDLQFFISTYEQMVDSYCVQCEQTKLCRSFCRKCQTKYCISCRMPPCSKNQCPLGHGFQQRQGIKLYDYICDICGFNTSKTKSKVYDDGQCNFGVCQFCYQRLPDQIDFSLKSKVGGNQNDCICGQLLTVSELQSTKAKCSICQCIKQCPRFCSKCERGYCLGCKHIKIYNNRCGQGHQLKFHKLLEQQQKKDCMQCAKTIDEYYFDEQCKIRLCVSCVQYAYSLTKDHMRMRDIQCDKGHILFYSNMPKPPGQCAKCHKTKDLILGCFKCHADKELYCGQCMMLPFNACYFGHPLENCEMAQKQSLQLHCLICGVSKIQLKQCRKCRFYACDECIDLSMNASQKVNITFSQQFQCAQIL